MRILPMSCRATHISIGNTSKASVILAASGFPCGFICVTHSTFSAESMDTTCTTELLRLMEVPTRLLARNMADVSIGYSAEALAQMYGEGMDP